MPVALRHVNLYYARGVQVGGRATLWVRNAGNADYTGPVSGTIYREPGTYVSGVEGTYDQQVTIKRGARAKLSIRVWPPPFGFDFIYTITADAPGDPTPGQRASAKATIVWRSPV